MYNECNDCYYYAECYNEYDEYMGSYCVNEESSEYNKRVYSDDSCEKFKER